MDISTELVSRENMQKVYPAPFASAFCQHLLHTAQNRTRAKNSVYQIRYDTQYFPPRHDIWTSVPNQSAGEYAVIRAVVIETIIRPEYTKYKIH